MVRLPVQYSAAFALQSLLSASIDQLDKTDAPLITEAYICFLGAQCLVPISDGLTGYTFPLYNALAVQKPPAGSTKRVRAPGPLDHTTLPETEPARVGLQTVHGMLIAQAGLRFSPPSFSFTTNLFDPIFGDVLDVQVALPPRVVAALDEPSQASPSVRSPVSLFGFTLGLAGGGGGGAAPQPPGLSLALS